ncbi:hypothetical protein WJX72_006811 [[Myrmecia] bisecta]|uniref:Uncharacterized protein n=1 Tax=[Myrmecia] bisecta TaxID=41462 RepID=A0AAW1PBQ1_9CHLO
MKHASSMLVVVLSTLLATNLMTATATDPGRGLDNKSMLMQQLKGSMTNIGGSNQETPADLHFIYDTASDSYLLEDLELAGQLAVSMTIDPMAHFHIITSLQPSYSRSARARVLAEVAANPFSGDVQLSTTDLCILQAIGGQYSDPNLGPVTTAVNATECASLVGNVTTASPTSTTDSGPLTAILPNTSSPAVDSPIASDSPANPSSQAQTPATPPPTTPAAKSPASKATISLIVTFSMASVDRLAKPLTFLRPAPNGKRTSLVTPASTTREMATHAPPFEAQDQDWPGQEHLMDPKPDYGYDTYKGSGKLQDKVALITGADSGIGRAVALAYAREGAHVAIAYYNEHKDAEETKRVVEEAGRQSILLPGDLVDDAVCRKIVDETVKKFGRIDILVNNAAYQHDTVDKFTDISRERLERAFSTNIIAMFRLCQLAHPHMKKGGAIINVGSIQAYKPSPGILDYATTKGAIVAFTKGLAQQLITEGIRVNAVAPGPVWTPLVVQSFPDKKVENLGKGSNPTERPAQPWELAPAFVFLACDKDSSYIAGEILAVTGGAPNVS